MDASNNWPCWSGFTWDRKYFPQPEAFLDWCKARGLHNSLNLHFQSGLQREEERFEQVGQHRSSSARRGSRALPFLPTVASEHSLAPSARWGNLRTLFHHLSVVPVSFGSMLRQISALPAASERFHATLCSPSCPTSLRHLFALGKLQLDSAKSQTHFPLNPPFLFRAQLREALGLPAAAKYVPFEPLNQTYAREFHRVVLKPLEASGVDLCTHAALDALP